MLTLVFEISLAASLCFCRPVPDLGLRLNPLTAGICDAVEFLLWVLDSDAPHLRSHTKGSMESVTSTVARWQLRCNTDAADRIALYLPGDPPFLLGSWVRSRASIRKASFGFILHGIPT